MLVPAAASDAAVRYASPTSTVAPGLCPKVNPCYVQYAVESASSGDEAALLAGT
ncbi:MAG: hypothetical protein QOJ89_3153 [bacterium]